jgi:DNA-binding CsgD family transcriptional regulator
MPDPMSAGTNTLTNARGVTARMLAAQLQLHPATVYAHLKQIRLLTAHEMRETQEMLADGSQ